MHYTALVKKLCLTTAFALFLSGCATPLPMNYTPSSVMSISGSLSVGEFEYLPFTSGKVDANQIRNTALGSAKFDKNINVFFRDALFSELRVAGANMNGSQRILEGEILEFLDRQLS